MPWPQSRIAATVCFVTLANAQNLNDDDLDNGHDNNVRRVIAGVIIALVILLTVVSCWLYSLRRRRQAQMARQNFNQSDRFGYGYSNTYDVNSRFNYGDQGWMGPPPPGPPPPGYTQSPHPGYEGPYQPPSQPPPGYGDKAPDGSFSYPPPPGFPPLTGSQQHPPVSPFAVSDPTRITKLFLHSVAPRTSTSSSCSFREFT
ncbi:hypothetical protein L218DRAFT_1075793 [Marasmius fiardii PR-910]|nr:hypothetical protein L218DRAFT_1075793 [Marasmius fiardii PR-910]